MNLVKLLETMGSDAQMGFKARFTQEVNKAYLPCEQKAALLNKDKVSLLSILNLKNDNKIIIMSPEPA